jgi:hypothetical protein
VLFVDGTGRCSLPIATYIRKTSILPFKYIQAVHASHILLSNS